MLVLGVYIYWVKLKWISLLSAVQMSILFLKIFEIVQLHLPHTIMLVQDIQNCG